jgi:hypothetical protein
MVKLKCWKKIRNYNDEIEFIRYSPINRISISKFPRTKSRWRTDKTDKEYKSKSQALSFANKYMKSHDKC